MQTRSRFRKLTAFGGALSIAAGVLGIAVSTPASGAARVAPAPATMPDAGRQGLRRAAHGAGRSRLPAAVAERRVHGRGRDTPTGRRLNISSKVDPTNMQRRARRRRPRRTRATASRRARSIMTYVPGLEPRRSRRSRRRPTSASRSRRTRRSSSSTRRRTRACRTSPSSTRRRRTRPSSCSSSTRRSRSPRGTATRSRCATSSNGNGTTIAPLASTTAALAGTLKPATRGAHIKWVIRHDLASVLGSTVPYQAWDFTVASAKSLAGPALTMRKLAYQWLATHHVASTATDGRDRLRARVHGHVGDRHQRRARRARHVPGAAVPRRHHAALEARDRPRRQPDDQRHARPGPPTSSACCRRRCRAPGRRRRPSTATACSAAPSEVEGGSFSAGVARRPHGLRDRLGRHVGARHRQRGPQPPGHVDVRHPGRPHAAGLRELPVPRSPHQLVVGLRHRTPRSSPAASRCSRRTTATSWATARAASWAARCRRSRPSGAASILGVPGMDYGGLLLNRSVDWNEFSAVYDVSYTDPVDQQVVLQLAQLLWDRGENEGYAEHLTVEPVRRHPGQAGLHHRELRRPPGDERRGRDAGADDRRAQPPARVRPVASSARRRAPNVPVTPQWGLAQAGPDEAGHGRARAVGLRHADAAHHQPRAERRRLRLRPARLRARQRAAARRRSRRSCRRA